MKDNIAKNILRATGATEITKIEDIQSLWSGYGVIQRVELKGGNYPSVILKDIDTTRGNQHPRGWDTNLSYQRKMKSYQVEISWYKCLNQLNEVDDHSKSPKCIGSFNDGNEMFIILEDLNTSGYPERVVDASWSDIILCLKWLAHFHAKYLGVTPKDLWETGTYWHLETRPDELKEIEGTPLHHWASHIDNKLKGSQFQTIVHGDAKLANFCFGNNRVSAVDFQYIGGGCGMKDVAYFIGSCLDEHLCEEKESEILEVYFNELKLAVELGKKQVDFDALEQEWHKLYSYAWCDFYRFLKGWSPDHWKINSYSNKVAESVISELELEHAAK